MNLYRRIGPRLSAFALRGCQDHIFHGPNFYLPPFAGTSVVTIHDLTPYLWPECLPAERVRYMQSEIALSLQRADLLITVSDYVRTEIVRYFSWPLEKVHAVPLAAADSFHPRTAAALDPLLRRYSLSAGGYCLFAGTIEPRKNIDTLLDAYGMLSAATRRKWPLVLAGYHGWKSDALHARLAEAEREGWARYLGYVPEHHLPLLFAGARLFAFPSLYEGFGLPVLEAMASGVPVVCADSAALPEVAGDAAAMCASLDVDALHRLLDQGLKDPQWRNAAVGKGLKRAGQFTWRCCAENTITAYRAAAGTKYSAAPSARKQP